MNFKDILLNYMSKEDIEKIEKTKITIAGCGGLGSNIAKLLARTGFINITLIDFDVVEPKNLNRQDFYISQTGLFKVDALKENLLKINKDLNLKTINIKISQENIDILKDTDIVAEAVDRDEYKRIIFEYCIQNNIKVVCASGIAGFGDCEKLKIKRGKNFSIVGDFTKSITDFSPLSPKVTAVAAFQADEVLRMVLNSEE